MLSSDLSWKKRITVGNSQQNINYTLILYVTLAVFFCVHNQQNCQFMCETSGRLYTKKVYSCF